MLLAIETLIDDLVRTLTEAVAPEVRTRYARGQLWTAIDVLRNLRDRIEAKASLAADEAADAEATLGRVVELLRAAGAGAAAERVAGAAEAAPASPPSSRAAALRAALVTAIDTLDALPAATAAPARAAIEQHLTSQAFRDVSVLKPSLLAEISGAEGS